MTAFPDTEAGVVQFLKDDTPTAALVGTRVMYGVPRKSPTFPLIVVRRLSGGDDGSEAPIDQAVVAIDCWGRSKLEATNVTNAVRAALHDLRFATVKDGVTLHGAIVDGMTWLPDPEDDRPRYTLSVRVTASV